MKQPICEESYPSLVAQLEEKYLLGIFWVTPIKNFVINNNSLDYVSRRVCCNSKKIISNDQIDRQVRLFSTKVVDQVHNTTTVTHKIHPGTVRCFNFFLFFYFELLIFHWTNITINKNNKKKSDGEGSFSVSILKDKNYICGWRVKPVFTRPVGLHIKDEIFFKDIQNIFGPFVGKIYKLKVDLIQLRVFSAFRPKSITSWKGGLMSPRKQRGGASPPLC